MILATTCVLVLSLSAPRTDFLDINADGFEYRGHVCETTFDVSQAWGDEGAFESFIECASLQWAVTMAAPPKAEPGGSGTPLQQCMEVAVATCGAGNVASLKVTGGSGGSSCEFTCKPTVSNPSAPKAID